MKSSMAEIFLIKGDNDNALTMIQNALTLAPKNPKYLDFLIELSILINNKYLAEITWDKLKEVNPENQKLAGLQERIQAIATPL